MPPSALAAYADSLLASLCERHPLGYTPRLVWKNLRVTAGTAYYKSGEIALSALLLTDEARIESTLTHEFAHLLAFVRHGQKAAGHGRWWRQAMLDLGQQPLVRHRYEVQRNASRQQVAYVCAKCGATLLRARRLPKRRRYLHSNCGGPIKFAWAKAVAQD